MLIYNPKVATDMNLVTYGRFLRFASGQYTKVDLDNLTLTWLFCICLASKSAYLSHGLYVDKVFVAPGGRIPVQKIKSRHIIL